MPFPPSSPPLAAQKRVRSQGTVPTRHGRRDDGKTGDGHNDQTQAVYDDDDSFALPPLPQDDSSLLELPSEDGDSRMDKTVDERELKRKLMDIESSFIPGQDSVLMTAPQADESDHDDSRAAMPPPPHPRLYQQPSKTGSTLQVAADTKPTEHSQSHSPPTPPDAYQTPNIQQHEFQTDEPSMLEGNAEGDTNLSSLETMSSSPTAAAAARTISRAVSAATASGYATAEDRSLERPGSNDDQLHDEPDQETPRKPNEIPVPDAEDGSGSTRSPTRSSFVTAISTSGDSHENTATLSREPSVSLPSRPSQRLSASSFTSSKFSQDGASDATLGVPPTSHPDGSSTAGDGAGRPSLGLSRSTSLGSIASGITGFDDSGSAWDRGRTVSGTSVLTMGQSDRHLDRLDEEERTPEAEDASQRRYPDPKTPKASTARSLTAPTDTVIAQHVRDIHVPASVAREFSKNNRPVSPEKRAGMPTPLSGRGKGLTLKEQSSTIDRLQKENFDLKLKIHYLNQALNERSEEGVKEMISENVELKAGLVMMEKQARTLRKNIRDLEKVMKEKEEGTAAAAAANVDQHKGQDSPASTDNNGLNQELEEEVAYLRERVETYEIELEKIRSEGVAREGEKRRMAEVIKSVGNRRNADPDIGAREETDMWKDLLDGETARREQADADNQKLREEIWRLRNEGSTTTATTTNNHTRKVYNVSKRQTMPSRTYSGGSATTADERNGAASAASSTLVEQLRHENEELRREVGAQTSMLTSRNREKERLYQEIEDLKLGHMRGEGGRSMAGDSILERSASRAHVRNASRVSNDTRQTALSDHERDDYEAKNGQLRDENSTLKLTNQELERNLEATLDDLDKAEAANRDLDKAVAAYQGEVDLLTQDLQTMQAERDEALGLREEVEAEFENLKNEAQLEINALEAELDQKAEEHQQLETEMANRDENFNALQAEMRSMSEGVVRLEDDHQSKGRRIESLQQELHDATAEIESLEKTMREANGKIERFTVQQESSQSEIAFLREEQDGDKIKIGDLDSALTEAESSIQDGRERARELEKRLVDERHQRELIGSKEKQEVQRAMNDVNREASAAKDEARSLRKNLSAREIEATEWKERLIELENNLREALGDQTGTRSSLLTSVTKLQKELEENVHELEITRNLVAEKDRVLRHRDALLENTGLENRRIAELLERERLARKADEFRYENLQRTTQHTTRTVTQQETRVKELESGRASDRKKLAALETQSTNQLMERNNLLLALWNRLSTLCGTDWAHKNTLVNGRLPSIEVVASMLPGFGKNLLLAVKTVEALVGGFRGRVRTLEHDLRKQYQTLEHDLEARGKKLDRLEAVVNSRRVSSSSSSSTSSEVMKLRSENRSLKHELSALQQQRPESRASQPRGPPGRIPVRDVSRGANSSLTRHHSTSAVEATGSALDLRRPPTSSESVDEIPDDDPAEQRWVHRLRELERRLKAEREARLLDRNGARKRLEEGRAENEVLRQELEKQKVRREEREG